MPKCKSKKNSLGLMLKLLSFLLVAMRMVGNEEYIE